MRHDVPSGNTFQLCSVSLVLMALVRGRSVSPALETSVFYLAGLMTAFGANTTAVPVDGAATPIFKPTAQGTLPILPFRMDLLKEAMISVVKNPLGTASFRLRGLTIPVAGKTGTAESGNGLPHAWFAGYTMASEDTSLPDIAIAVILENQGEGSDYAAPVFTYVQLTTARFRWEGPSALTPGKHTIVFDFKYDGPGFGKGGTGVLSVDGKEVDRKTMPHSIPFLVSFDESFDVGIDTRYGMDDNDYQPPFRFTGKLLKLTIKLEEPRRSAEEERFLKQATQAARNAAH
jgi:arylsulfatase